MNEVRSLFKDTGTMVLITLDLIFTSITLLHISLPLLHKLRKSCMK